MTKKHAKPKHSRKRELRKLTERERADVLEHLAESALQSAALLIGLTSAASGRPYLVCMHEVADLSHTLVHAFEDEIEARGRAAARKPRRKP